MNFKVSPARSRQRRLLTALPWLLISACSDTDGTSGTGEVSVLLEPEDTILQGLRPGSGAGEIRDGWRVTFDKYLVGIGHIEVRLATDLDVRASDDDAYIVDLTKVAPSGEALWSIDGLTPGRWTFGYELVGGGHGVKRGQGVASDDFERMVDEDLTYLISGTLQKNDGVSCPPSRYVEDITDTRQGENQAGDPCYANESITFEFAVRAETQFTNCGIDGIPGFSVSASGVSTVAATLHGDHLFFNGFPTGSEGGIQRLAQIWADTDLNLDGKISSSEFEDLLIADMSEWDSRYQGGGAPGKGGVTTLGDLAEGQLKTQGHMDGEGECDPDGEPHNHDHGDDEHDEHDEHDAGEHHDEHDAGEHHDEHDAGEHHDEHDAGEHHDEHDAGS